MFLTFQYGTNEKESLPLELPIQVMTVKEIIQFSVQAFASEMVLKNKLSIDECKKQIRRKFLTQKEIDSMANSGRIVLENNVPANLSVDVNLEMEKALKAFNEKVFFLLIDGRQQTDLNTEIELKADSKIFFVRIVPLVGG